MTLQPRRASSHAAVQSVLRGPGWTSDQRGASQVPELAAEALSSLLLFMEAPDHTRLRGLISKAFTPRSVEQLRPRIVNLTEELLGPLREAGRFDVIGDFAFPLPVTVICELLGVPAADRNLFRSLTSDMAAVIDLDATPEEYGRAAGAALTFTAYLVPLFEQRRRDPRDDLVSALVAAEHAGDHLAADELLTTVMLLLIAGHETTMNLIGNGLLALLRHPNQLQLLREQPELMPGAVEELLRYDTPVRRVSRVATQDSILDGQHVSAGEQVIAMLHDANHDHTVFPSPDLLDITRDARRHVSFGGGAHYCLGAPLARAEAQVALAALIHLPDLELTTDGPQWRRMETLHALHSLPVRLNTAALPTAAATR